MQQRICTRSGFEKASTDDEAAHDAEFAACTDALRRHQRSRHNGIVINPIDPLNSKDTEGDGEGSTASALQSRSGSPTTNKGRRSKNSSSANASSSTPVQTIVTRPDASGLSSGSQSYYRQNTINPVFVPPHTPSGAQDSSNYQSTQIPTSAARFHAWVPNPPWIQENPNMPRPTGPITFIHPSPPGYYAPGAYYRSPDGQPAMPMHALPHGVVTMQVNPNPPIPQPAANPHSPSEGNTNGTSNELSANSNNNIDPSLEALSPAVQETDGKEGTKERELVAGSFADTGLSAAVQKALQAVLAIDPSLNAAVAAAQAAIPQTSIEDQKPYYNGIAEAVSPVDASSSSTPPGTTVALIQPPPPSTDGIDKTNGKDKDAVMDVDADGEADSDGDGPFQEERSSR
ncbi:hypothetical protein EW145_g530 [Phellinidium pouzarii]|uniref:Uncharacterized protein n=1 Tax=Phellinidium pouzarii TaxID=167371 RepID=A0A4S4LNF1_9AGAM|nr:hypothetical protein EW145_g530 [Phellinidium pouzarii]